MRKYLMGIVGLLLLLSGISACDSGSNNQQTTDATGTATTALDSTLSEGRQELFTYTARHILLQRELASMAQQRAQTDSLKLYAQNLNNWATTKLNELKDLGQQYGVSVPQQLTEDEQKYLEKPQEAEANKFDTELWDNMVEAQKDAINHIDSEVKDIASSDVTAFAIWERNTLKELRAHMEQAAAYELELKTRSEGGGISKPILEEINN